MVKSKANTGKQLRIASISFFVSSTVGIIVYEPAPLLYGRCLCINRVESSTFKRQMNYSNKRRIERLIKQHGHTLVNFLSKRLKSREDAEDIAQSTFLRLYTMDTPEKVNNPRAFLFQVAANMSVDQLRRQARMNSYLEKEHTKSR